MTVLVKPPRRGPKPRRRIARKAPIRRSCTSLARVSRIRPMSKSKRARDEREAATLCSRITLAEAGYRCEAVDGYLELGAGKFALVFERCLREATDCMHVLSKASQPSLRFELSNLIAGCRTHHDILGSAKLAGPCEMRDLYIRLRGERAWRNLVTLASRQKTFGPEVLEQLRARAVALGIR